MAVVCENLHKLSADDNYCRECGRRAISISNEVEKEETPSLLVRAMTPAGWLVAKIKKTGLRTNHIERFFVFGVLSLICICSGGTLDIWRWIEVFAVLLTFEHASISQRMEEKQQELAVQTGKASVECYKKLRPLFVGKEILWMTAFIHLRAWPALGGVVIFLLFYPWRIAWRKYQKTLEKKNGM